MLVVRGFIAFQDRSPRSADAFATRNEMSSDVLPSCQECMSSIPKPSGLHRSNILVIQGQIKETLEN